MRSLTVAIALLACVSASPSSRAQEEIAVRVRTGIINPALETLTSGNIKFSSPVTEPLGASEPQILLAVAGQRVQSTSQTFVLANGAIKPDGFELRVIDQQGKPVSVKGIAVQYMAVFQVKLPASVPPIPSLPIRTVYQECELDGAGCTASCAGDQVIIGGFCPREAPISLVSPTLATCPGVRGNSMAVKCLKR
jgi:hypothetical protein